MNVLWLLLAVFVGAILATAVCLAMVAKAMHAMVLMQEMTIRLAASASGIHDLPLFAPPGFRATSKAATPESDPELSASEASAGGNDAGAGGAKASFQDRTPDVSDPASVPLDSPHSERVLRDIKAGVEFPASGSSGGEAGSPAKRQA